MDIEKNFAADQKYGASYFTGFEEWAKKLIIPRMPSWIQGYHLTLMTIPITIGILICSILAKGNIQWLWAVSFLIFCHYVTDSLDGGLNKYRNLGLIRWGYYMDHFLDFLFMSAVLSGYYFIMNDRSQYLIFFTLIIFGAYMVNTFLAFAVTNKLRITYMRIGPTEMRLIFIVVNSLLCLFGSTHLGVIWPYFLVIALIGLWMFVYQTQKTIWEIDMEMKELEKQQKDKERTS